MTSSHRFTSQERKREAQNGFIERKPEQHKFVGQSVRHCIKCGVYEEEADDEPCYLLRGPNPKPLTK